MKCDMYDERNITKTVKLLLQPLSRGVVSQRNCHWSSSKPLPRLPRLQVATLPNKLLLKFFWGESDKTLCSFTADPLTLSVSACLGLHLTLKTTFACVDKSVFQPKFVDRVTTTTTTTTPPTTSTLPTTRTPATRGRWQEFSTEYWDAEDEGELGVQAKPLEPKPISEEEPAHVIHIDHAAEEGGEEAENFAKVKDQVRAF